MQRLREEALKAFEGRRDVKVITDHYDANFFGNVIFEYKFQQIYVKIIKDRGQYFIDVGFSKDNMRSFWDILENIGTPHPFRRNSPSDEIPEGFISAIGFLILENYGEIVRILRK